MVASAKGSIKFDLSGNLNTGLKESQENMSGLYKATKDQTEQFGKFSKEGKSSESLLINLAKSSQDLANNIVKFTKTGKDTTNFILDSASATIKLDEAVDNASSGVSGLGLKFLGLNDEVDSLNRVISGPAEGLAEIAYASNNTERAFILLNAAEKPLVKGFTFLSNQAERLSNSFLFLEDGIANVSKTIVNTGANALTFFSGTLQDVSQSMKSSGLLGRFLSKGVGELGKSLGSSAEKAEAFASNIDSKNLERADKVGNTLSQTFNGLGKNLDKATKGVQLADFAGDVYRTSLAAKEMGGNFRDNVADGLGKAGETVNRFGGASLILGNKLMIAQGAVKGLSLLVKNNLTKSLNQGLNILGKFSVGFATFGTLSSGAYDAFLQTQGLNDAFSQMQSLGIDSSAAQIAFQFGFVGEKLLFSAQAAKEFGQTAITAFSQLEDAAAFVTTIGAGAGIQLEGLEGGIESISASMTDLVSGPLKNTITSTDAANALYNALSAGVGVAADGTANLGETNEFLAASLKLSAGTGSNAAQTLDLLAKTTKVYGLSNTEAQKTASKLYQIVEQGVTTFPELTNGLGRTLGSAKALGVSLEEAGGSVAALTKVMSTTDTLTGYQSLLNAIAGQGAESAKAVQELGIRFDAATVKTKGLLPALEDLYNATGGNQEQIKKIIPDTLAFQTAMTLMTTAGSDAAATMQKMQETGGGALDTVFENRQQSVIKRFTNLMNGYNEVLVDFGRRALPAIAPGVTFLEGLLNVLQNLPEPLKNIIGGVILAQTAISNIGGGMLTLLTTVGKVVLGIVAYRLATKALTGQLGEEFDILKDLILVKRDVVGASTRLLGINEKLADSSVKVTKARLAQIDISKKLAKQGILVNERAQVEELEAALQEVKVRKKELKESNLKVVDNAAFQKQKKMLQQLENRVKSSISTINLANKSASKELNKAINVALTDSKLTIDQKKQAIDKSLNSLLDIFGITGKKAKNQFRNTFDSILGNTDLTVDQKVQKINQSLRDIGVETPATFKEFLNSSLDSLERGMQKLDSTTKQYSTQVSNSFTAFLNEIEARGGSQEILGDLENKFRNSFSNIENDIKSRRSSLTQAVQSTVDTLPQEFEKVSPKMREAINQILNNAEIPIENRKKRFNILFAQALEGADDGIKQTIPTIQKSILDLVNKVEGTLSSSEVDTKVKTYFDNTKNTVNTSLLELRQVINEKSQLVSSSFRELLEGVDIQGSSKQIFQDISDDINKNVQSLSQGSIKLEEFNNYFAEAQRKANKELAKISDPETREKIKSRLEDLKSNLESQLEKVSIATKTETDKVKTYLQNSLGRSLDDLKDEVARKGRALQNTFTTTFNSLVEQSNLPESIQSSFTEAKQELNTQLNSLVRGNSTIEQTETKFKEFSEKVQLEITKIGDSETSNKVKQQLETLKTSFSKSLESLSQESQTRFASLQERVSNSLEQIATPESRQKLQTNFESILSSSQLTIEEKTDQINQALKSIAEDVSPRIQQRLGELKDISSEKISEVRTVITEKSALVQQAFSNLFENVNLKEESEAIFKQVKESIESNLEKLSSGDISLEKFEEAFTEARLKVNTELEKISDDSVRAEVRSNLEKVQQSVEIQLQETRQIAEVESQRINQSIRGNVGKAGNSVASLLGNFVPGVALFQGVANDAVDAFQDLGQMFPKLSGKQKMVTATTGGLNAATKGLSSSLGENLGKTKQLIKQEGILGAVRKATSGELFSVNKGAKGLTDNTTALTKSLKGGQFALKGVGKSLGGLVGFLKGAAAFAGKFLATLAPFAAIGVAVAGALYGLHNAVKLLIPAYARATDANAKFAFSLKETNADIEESTGKLQDLTKSAAELEKLDLSSPLEGLKEDIGIENLGNLSTEQIQKITGASKEEIEKLRKEVIAASQPEEKAFLQGWRAPVFGIVEFITQTFLVKLPELIFGGLANVAKGYLGIISGVFEKLPIVGKVFDKLNQKTEDSLFQMEKKIQEREAGIRNLFNTARENIQARIRKEAEEEVNALSEAISDLMTETAAIQRDFEAGRAASLDSESKFQESIREERALTGEELKTVLSNEATLYEEVRAQNSAVIEDLRKRKEETKDKVILERLDEEIARLEQRNIELEKGFKLQQKFMQDQNALLNARDTNRAAQGQEELVNKVQNLYNDLPEEAKKSFEDITGAIIDETGKVEQLTGNLTSSAQRRSAAASSVAIATFQDTLANADVAGADVNTDKISTDLLNAIEAVDADVQAGVIDFAAGEEMKQKLQNQIVNLSEGRQATAVELLRPDLLQSLLDSNISAIEEAANREVALSEEKIKQIRILESTNLLGPVEAAQQVENLQNEIDQKRLEAKRQMVDAIVEVEGEGSEKAKIAMRELETLELQTNLNRFNNRKATLDAELKLLQQKLDNEFNAIKAGFDKELGLQEVKNKAIAQEQKVLQSRKEFSDSLVALADAQAQAELKFTGDVEERAEIELEMAQRKQVSLENEQKFEKENIILQQELNKLALQREKIQLRINAAEIEKNKASLEAKLAEASSLGLTKEEITALEIQRGALEDQAALNVTQQEQLEGFAAQQEEINQRQLESLELRQEAARVTSAAEVELAELNLVLAGYEKQKQQIQNQAKIQELQGQARITQLNAEETLLKNQSDILQKQAELVKGTADIANSYYQIAINATQSEARRRRLEKEAAEARLKSLEKTQKIEQMTFEIQQQQNRLALQRKQIELEVAQIKAQADLAVQEAEAAKIQADPRKSAEEKEAARLQVEAARANLDAIGLQQQALSSEAQLQQVSENVGRQQFQQRQQQEILQARADVAQTTRNRGDDFQVRRDAELAAQANLAEFDNLFNRFTNPSLASNSISPQAALGGSQTALPSNNVGTLSLTPSEPLEVILKVTIDGEGSQALSPGSLDGAISDNLNQGLNQLFNYMIRRQ